jgi:signal transduction histidine kinase
MIQELSGPANVSHLSENRLFAGIAPGLIEMIAAHMSLLQLEAGDILFHEGDPGDCLYVVCHGTICISKKGRASKQETLLYMQGGNFFGEMALIDGQPRSAQAMASAPTLLGRVNRTTFDQILTIAPSQLHMNFLHSVVERLRDVNGQFMTELMRQERLALVGSMANSIIHDLKNPICVIRLCAEILPMKVKSPEAAKFSGMVTKAVDSMLDMTQELLDYARGQSSLELKRVSTRAIIAQVSEQIRQIAPKSVQLIEDCHCEAQMLADSGRFTRMLLNLIKNAIEAMPDGGVLRFAVRQSGSLIIFRVCDTGCGIAPASFDRIRRAGSPGYQAAVRQMGKRACSTLNHCRGPRF